MKAIPQYSDFELDYKKFPIRQVGGIQDMNYVNRMDYRDSMFKNAKEQWMEEAEQQIKELEEFKDMTIRSCIVGLEEGEQKKFDKIVNNQK